MGILEAIKKAFKILPEIASDIGQLVLVVIIISLVAGVFVYESVTTGNINVDGNSSGVITGATANWSVIINSVWNAANSVTGFIVIGVIALIAAVILGKKFGGNMRV